MKYLNFFVRFAYTQSENDSDYVSVRMIKQGSGMSKSSIHRYLNALIDAGFIYRYARGRYRVQRNEFTMAVGLTTLSPLDINAFWQKRYFAKPMKLGADS